MDNISAVREKINIIDLVNGYLPLRRSGKNYKANCPFHNEKTPSFMVSEDIQRYKCFGCGKSGDIFTFVMEMEGVDFAEALKLLADKAGVKLKYDNKQSQEEKSQKEKIIRINELTAQFYSYILWKNEFGQTAREYLKNRKIKDQTALTFKIGYAPKSWNSLSKFLLDKGFTEQELVMAGVSKYRDSSMSDKARLDSKELSIGKNVGNKGNGDGNENGNGNGNESGIGKKIVNDKENKKNGTVSSNKKSSYDYGVSVYDMFRGRLMFPLVDHMSRIIGFAGRALSPDQEPKYINTQETPIFHKEHFLFGINHAKTPIKQKGYAIIVEGEFDMITPFQAGFTNIVASKGTALTIGQINLIKRYADTIVLVFDSDDAGIDAAVRGVQVIQNSEVNIKVATLPKEYKDPDEITQKDAKLFEQVISEALPLWDFYFLYAKNKYDFSDIYDKKRASDFLAHKISSITDQVVKSEYLKKFQILFDVSEESAVAIINKVQNEPLKIVSQLRASKDEKPLEDNTNKWMGNNSPLEIYLLSLLIKADDKILEFYIDQIKEEYFQSEDTKKIFKLINDFYNSEKKLEVKKLYDTLRQEYTESYNLFESVYLLDPGDQLLTAEQLEAEITITANRIKRSYLNNKLKNLAKEVREAESASDAELVKKLQAQIKETSDELAKVSS